MPLVAEAVETGPPADSLLADVVELSNDPDGVVAAVVEASVPLSTVGTLVKTVCKVDGGLSDGCVVATPVEALEVGAVVDTRLVVTGTPAEPMEDVTSVRNVVDTAVLLETVPEPAVGNTVLIGMLTADVRGILVEMTVADCTPEVVPAVKGKLDGIAVEGKFVASPVLDKRVDGKSVVGKRVETPELTDKLVTGIIGTTVESPVEDSADGLEATELTSEATPVDVIGIAEMVVGDETDGSAVVAAELCGPVVTDTIGTTLESPVADGTIVVDCDTEPKPEAASVDVTETAGEALSEVEGGTAVRLGDSPVVITGTNGMPVSDVLDGVIAVRPPELSVVIRGIAGVAAPDVLGLAEISETVDDTTGTPETSVGNSVGVAALVRLPTLSEAGTEVTVTTLLEASLGTRDD